MDLGLDERFDRKGGAKQGLIDNCRDSSDAGDLLEQRCIYEVLTCNDAVLGQGPRAALQLASVDTLDNKIIIPFWDLCGRILGRRARDIPAPARETD